MQGLRGGVFRRVLLPPALLLPIVRPETITGIPMSTPSSLRVFSRNPVISCISRMSGCIAQQKAELRKQLKTMEIAAELEAKRQLAAEVFEDIAVMISLN
jgi:hypothetical protein